MNCDLWSSHGRIFDHWTCSCRGGSIISGALGTISRLPPPLNDGPSYDGFQLTLSVSKFTYLINE